MTFIHENNPSGGLADGHRMAHRLRGTSVSGTEGNLDSFRMDAREWLAAHIPSDWARQLAGASRAKANEFQRWWLQELRQGGYAASHWPAEYGGAGHTLLEQVVLEEELARARAPYPNLYFVALNHTLATLNAHGSAEQQALLPRILEGEVWCQGFSEPEAGSDLAALRTRAVREGENYIVNGHKTWSSGADEADWCLLLARTDPAAPKRRGISYFLLDMRTPGVEVRPIMQATGDSEFSEIFLTDVVIPASARVGLENDGWRIAQTTLHAERGPVILALHRRLAGAFADLVELARVNGRGGDAAVRQSLASFTCELDVLELLIDRMLTDIQRDGSAGVGSSVIKLFYSELLQRMTGFGAELEGLPGQLMRNVPRGSGWNSGVWNLDHILSWSWTIAGGTNQVQRNLLAERVLGLPREPEAAA